MAKKAILKELIIKIPLFTDSALRLTSLTSLISPTSLTSLTRFFSFVSICVYWFYLTHKPRGLVSPVCGIFFTSSRDIRFRVCLS